VLLWSLGREIKENIEAEEEEKKKKKKPLRKGDRGKREEDKGRET